MKQEDKSNPEIKQGEKDNFTQLCIRIGKTKNHENAVHPDVTPIQQKGRRILIQLRERVKNELNKLIDQKHIIIWKSVQTNNLSV